MSRESKLVELRRKTERDLLNLVRRELDRGLALADVATTKEPALYAQAERAYQMMRTWLPLVSGLSREERRELELKLKELSSTLDRARSENMKRHLANSSAG